MDRKKYYVNAGSKEISQVRFDNNDVFTIFATDDEVNTLRHKMNNMDASDTRTFFRAHVPIKPYHDDESNDDYDHEITEAYRMIHALGDDETKQHITTMGILSDRDL
ncbi:hypothetical protein GCM10008983_00990 [Lentibacillus halophilus]|uniref:Hydrolase n=1 Tax=Lentibacillus halophilus TaxID=295065 RepID=A0ABN0Z1V7_9BACI